MLFESNGCAPALFPLSENCSFMNRNYVIILKSIGTSFVLCAVLLHIFCYIKMLLAKRQGTKVSTYSEFETKLIIFSFTFIIAIYHIVGPYHTAAFYKLFLIFHIIYLVLGNIFYIFTQK
jgi:hypothetical protein